MIDHLEILKQSNITEGSRHADRQMLRATVQAMASCVFPFIDCSLSNSPNGEIVITLDYAPPEMASVKFDERTRTTKYEVGDNVFRNIYTLVFEEVRWLYEKNTVIVSEQIARKIIQKCVDLAIGRYKSPGKRPKIK